MFALNQKNSNSGKQSNQILETGFEIYRQNHIIILSIINLLSSLSLIISDDQSDNGRLSRHQSLIGTLKCVFELVQHRRKRRVMQVALLQLICRSIKYIFHIFYVLFSIFLIIINIFKKSFKL